MKDSEDQGIWKKIPVIGKTPGKRYGHSLAFMKPYFVLFGGNINSHVSNDVWIISLDNIQYSWEKIDFGSAPEPSPRLYHSCGFSQSGNAQGMMILFGGRDRNESPLGDIWGLRRSKDGIWEWVQAPTPKGNKIQARYNHSIVFYGSFLIIIGGRSSNIHDILPIELYDTDVNETYQFLGIGRYRHSTLLKDTSLFIYGGFKMTNPNKPLDTMTQLDLSSLFSGSLLYDKFVAISHSLTNKKIDSFTTKSIYNSPKRDREKKQSIFTNNIAPKTKSISKFKLSHQAVVGKLSNDDAEVMDDTITLFRKVSIDKLPEETKRIGHEKVTSQLQSRRVYNYVLIDKFIETLLRPFDWYCPEVEEIHNKLPFTIEDVKTLIEEAKPLIEKDPTLIKIRSPCKIFGNLNGQYNDLMRFFESFGNPSDENQMGDIYVMQYVFLGDLCDRGYHSIEIILLLLALKVKYPEYIYIVRGHHEDIEVNTICGLGEEFKDRLGVNLAKEDSIFMKINDLFNYLPLGVLVDEQILCLHGGIGSSISKLDDISSLKRPIQVNQTGTKPEDKKVLDILWSEYSDDVTDISPNEERDIYSKGIIVKFGKERLNQFLSDNNLNLLITSHQWIFEGIKTYDNEKLIIVYSATNYLNKYNNLGEMVKIAKKTTHRPLQILPKLINVFNFDKPAYKTNIKMQSPVRIKK